MLFCNGRNSLFHCCAGFVQVSEAVATRTFVAFDTSQAIVGEDFVAGTDTATRDDGAVVHVSGRQGVAHSHVLTGLRTLAVV